MNFLTKIKQAFTPVAKNYEIIPADYDLVIKHKSGVIVKIKEDGSVAISSANALELHSVGNLQISSDTHIGLVAPRIDLN